MPANQGGIPEKIKLGDKEYVVKDHPELLELLQKARKEEKDKLYSQISTLQASVKVLEDEKKSNGELSATKEKELKKLQDELAVVKAEKEKLEGASSGGSGADPDEDDDEDDDDPKKKGKKSRKSSEPSFTKKELQDMLKDALAEQQKAFDEKLAKVQGVLTQKTVSDYRKEQLAKHKGLLIEQLVPDNLDSVEAVNKAIKDALETSKSYISNEYEIDGKKQKMTIAEYEEYEAKQKDAGAGEQGGTGGQGTGNYTPPTPPQKPDGGSGDLSGKELLSKIDEMSDEEYAKHHKQLLKEVQSVKYGDEQS